MKAATSIEEGGTGATDEKQEIVYESRHKHMPTVWKKI